MKKVPCSYARCGERRIHHERPDEPRGQQMCTVSDEHQGVSYCSYTCACMDGAFHVAKGWMIDPKNPPERNADGDFHGVQPYPNGGFIPD